MVVQVPIIAVGLSILSAAAATRHGVEDTASEATVDQAGSISCVVQNNHGILARELASNAILNFVLKSA